MGRTIDPNEEFLITVGAYYSLYAVTQAFLNPGDEAIIMEPFFDCYSPMVKSRDHYSFSLSFDNF